MALLIDNPANHFLANTTHFDQMQKVSDLLRSCPLTHLGLLLFLLYSPIARDYNAAQGTVKEGYNVELFNIFVNRLIYCQKTMLLL